MRQAIMSRSHHALGFHIGDRIRVRLAHLCRHIHGDDTDGRIGTIRGVVTAEVLARDNATVTDRRDILTFEDFGDHVYSVDFTNPDAFDGEFCSASELERLPTWARTELARTAVTRVA
jgi:hypothetical protein